MLAAELVASRYTAGNPRPIAGPPMAAAEVSEMHDTDPIALPLYPLDRDVFRRVTEGEEEMRCSPASNRSLPLRFREGS